MQAGQVDQVQLGQLRYCGAGTHCRKQRKNDGRQQQGENGICQQLAAAVLPAAPGKVHHRQQDLRHQTGIGEGEDEFERNMAVDEYEPVGPIETEAPVEPHEHLVRPSRATAGGEIGRIAPAIENAIHATVQWAIATIRASRRCQ